VSEFSKQEIVRHLSIPDEKIHVTYNGVSKHYAPAVNSDHIAYIRSIYELPEHFILCLSNNKPHKNVLQLVRAYCFSNITIPLVLVCDVDQHLILIADTYGKKHLIYFAKFIEEEHLPALYTMTKLFVYPSTYEGFGLPPLEALACGARVVVARAASLPEVVGDHAIFMDPYDFKDIARSLEEGLREESQESDLKRKKQNIDYATKFSWEVMAEKTHALYERCLKGSTHR
jgi:glycosyltransferase involved in cell wall biosynthesis